MEIIYFDKFLSQKNNKYKIWRKIFFNSLKLFEPKKLYKQLDGTNVLCKKDICKSKQINCAKNCWKKNLILKKILNFKNLYNKI